MIHYPEQRGYTLLFAVLTAALVLGVAVFIVDVSRKQYELSVSARNSMYAFYAADSGIECSALAIQGSTISTSTGATIACGTESKTSPLCRISPVDSNCLLDDSSYPAPLVGPSDGGFPIYKSQNTENGNLNFNFDSDNHGNGCADITVYMGYDKYGNLWTILDSRGYNHCVTSDNGVSNSPDVNNPMTVERALRLGKEE